MTKRFKLDPLPYDYQALEPIISAETLHYHHDKHHRGYVDKLNELIDESAFVNAPLERIVQFATGPLFNNAAQHWNHDFYWKSMTPNKNQKPKGALLKDIENTFGSVKKFTDQFEKSATELFGSGWVWLVLDHNKELQILQTKDADNPLRHDLIPLFNCDVWEHAYYVDYHHERAKYLNKFSELIHWDFAQKNYENVSNFFETMGSEFISQSTMETFWSSNPFELS